MIEREEVLQLHERLNSQFWGTSGLRDERYLEAALNRPYVTFEGKELYRDTLEKTAAFAESMVKNHPFIEGNLRTAYVLLRLLLLEAGFELRASEEERLKFMLDIATSKLQYPEIAGWLQQHTVRRDEY